MLQAFNEQLFKERYYYCKMLNRFMKTLKKTKHLKVYKKKTQNSIEQF